MSPNIWPASCRARFAASLESIRSGIETGEIKLQQLLTLNHRHRRAIVEQDPLIDIYLGTTRVYKRSSRVMLLASCPDIRRFLKPVQGHEAVCLPDGSGNVLAVKLAVMYMEQYIIEIKFRQAPWKVEDGFVDYIYLAELFGLIGMSNAALKLQAAILQGIQRKPLKIYHIRAIWERENPEQPSRYAKAIAANIFTFAWVSKIENFLTEYDTNTIKTYRQPTANGTQRGAGVYDDARE